MALVNDFQKKLSMITSFRAAHSPLQTCQGESRCIGTDCHSFEHPFYLPMLAIRGTKLPQFGTLRVALRPQTRLLRSSTMPVGKSKTSPVTRPFKIQDNNISACARIQTRWLADHTQDSRRNTFTAPQHASVGAILRRALRFDLLFKGQSLRKLYRQSPEELVLALIL